MAKPWEQYQTQSKPWERYQSQGQSFDGVQDKPIAGGAGEAFVYGANQAVPFGSAITSGIGATVARLGGVDKPWSELYNEAYEMEKATQEANPKASLAGTATGVVGTLPLGGLNAVQKAGKFANTGNLAARAIKGAAVSAPIGALYGAGESVASGEDIAEGAKYGAGLAAGFGAAAPFAGATIGAGYRGGKNVVKGAMSRVEDVLEESLGVIKDSARSMYGKAEEAGAVFKPEYMNDMAIDLASKLKTGDLASQRLYSKTNAAVNDLLQDIQSGNTGLSTLDRHRQVLGNIGKDITNPNKAQEAQAANRIIDVIDDYVDNAGAKNIALGSDDAVQYLNDARKYWQQSKKFENISKIINNAGGDANKLKRDLERYRLNPKNTLGWSADEKEALKRASQQTTGEGILKLLGKFGFDLGSGRSVGNTALPLLGAGAGYAASGGLGAIVPAVGTAARQGQKYLARGKAEALLELIESQGKKALENKAVQSEIMKLPPSQAKAILNKVRGE